LFVFMDVGWARDVAVGDRVDVIGEVKEYFDLTEIDGTAASGITITPVGTGAPLAPEPLVSTDLSEAWEGVLVTVADAWITVPDLGFGEMQLGDAAGTFVVDDHMHGWAGFPGDALEAFDSVTGVVGHNFGAYKIEPRTAADLDTAGPVRIFEVQQEVFTPNDLIELEPAVVTGLGSNGLFVQRGAGWYSGLFVYLGNNWRTTWGEVLPGDTVAVSGLYTEFDGLSELHVPNAGVDGAFAVVGTEALPSPWITTPTDIAAYGEQLESVLVEVQDVTVASSDLGFGEWSVTDGTSTLVVDDFLHTSVLLSSRPPGREVRRIRGPLNHTFGAFKIEPRSEADAMPALDLTASPVAATPYHLQQSDVVEGTTVTLTGVATGLGRYGLFLQAGTGGERSGIWVFLGDGWQSTWTVARNDIVVVTGLYDEYFGVSEVDVTTSPSGSVTSFVPAGPVPPVHVRAGTLAGPAAEPWEGVVVEVRDVHVTSVAASSFQVGDDVGPDDGRVSSFLSTWSGFPPAVDDTFTSIAGPLHYTSVYQVAPRDDADLVP
ncbi:MAG: hypothetical protein KC656_22195, partial [Myxococcales bacterium]|nr:hypothetical protein [Myxococcales bacterium]